MRRVLAAAVWIVGLCVLGGALGALAAHGRLAAALGGKLPVPAVGAGFGGFVFLVLAGLGWLPGAGPKRGAAVAWGWPQAVWMVLQFFVMQVAGQVVCFLLAGAVVLGALKIFHVMLVGSSGGGMTGWMAPVAVASLVAGYLAASGWSVWYIGRLGWARVRDGGPAGIGWCAAPRSAYAAAVVGLVLVGAVEFLIQHVFPPDARALADDPMRKLFAGAGWKVAVLFVIAAGVAPFAEEFLFRGGVFSALSGRCGTVFAALLTSVLFAGAHFSEFVHYLPGFAVILAVALVLAWLRVRYRSIRPGILLHVLFNGLSVVAMAAGLGH